MALPPQPMLPLESALVDALVDYWVRGILTRAQIDLVIDDLGNRMVLESEKMLSSSPCTAGEGNMSHYRLNMLEESIVLQVHQTVIVDTCPPEHMALTLAHLGRGLRSQGYQFSHTAVLAVLYPSMDWGHIQVSLGPESPFPGPNP